MTRTFISGVLAALLASSALTPALAQGNGNGDDKGRSSEARADRDDGDSADRDDREDDDGDEAEDQDDDRDDESEDEAEDDDDEGGDRGKSDRARGRDDNPGLGRIRSELKNLNAANASEQALKNADPDSNVGQIAAYRDAVIASRGSYDDYAEDYETLSTLELQDYASASDEEIEAYVDTLDPESEEAQALNEYLESRTTYSRALGAESTALTELTGERQLSEPALREFREELGLE